MLRRFGSRSRALLAVLLAAGCGAGSDASDQSGTSSEAARARGALAEFDVTARAEGRVLARNGISITVPPAWDGRMLYRDANGTWGVVYQVANFELPTNEGLEPPTELPPGKEDPIKAMAGGDVLVTLVADAAAGRPTHARFAFRDLSPVRGARAPAGHRLYEGAFCVGGRCLDVSVDFGGEPDAALERAVGDLLASVSVETGGADPAAATDGPRGCPRPNWPGPWSRCAEARWVERVVEAAGYRVTGSTGSALEASGGRADFYIWTTAARRPPARFAAEGNWRQIGTSDGRAIYGDDDVWRLWEAQGFVFWLKPGPSATSKLPTLAELEPLVAASRRLAPPPP